MYRLPDFDLTPAQQERYARHLRLRGVGPEGQKRLLQSRVLVVGVGGLGSPAALYLAAAGVGTLGLLDDDRVSLSNLQRQVLYTTQDVGQPKVDAARRRLLALNPDANVVIHPLRLRPENALNLVAGYDLVVNASDNFPTRYLLSDACVLLRKPLVDASVVGFSGQVTAFLPGQGCYRCLFPAPPPPEAAPTCTEAGVLGALVGQLGAMEAMEAVKILLGIGDTLAGRLLLVDALAAEVQEVAWGRNPQCPACGDRPQISALAAVDYDAFCGLVPAPGLREQSGRQGPEDGFNLKPREVYDLLQQGRVRLVDVREPWEFAFYHAPGAQSLPMAFFRQLMGDLERDRDLVIVCEKGAHSAQVVDALRLAGLSRIFNLEGGMIAWLAENLPVVQGEA